MNDEKKKRDYILPVSIVIAALLISLSLFYSVGKKDENPSPKEANQLQTLPVIKPVTQDDHILGDPRAKIVVVEYADLECPFCKAFHNTMKELLSLYQGKMALVYRHYPLEEIHSKARNEAEASECAASLGGETAFWSFVDRLFMITPSNNNLDPAELPKIAQYIGLDTGAFSSCLKNRTFRDKVQRYVDDGNAIDMKSRGTPFSIVLVDGVEKQSISGALPFDTLKAYFDTLVR